ncbi:MAG: YhcH/YjgK/YiaL family protein [Arcobacter sp.]|nr:YhcH/YjgK/YiaL family protein [Arcobacter sp.]|tara:strand:- start:6648 stop:7127 length:480 start_codon:yes stop_codon:yes gene_type:complete
MAIFGSLEEVKKQVSKEAFQIAFDYLENITDDFLDIKDGECVKEMISEDIFVLKQAYYTKNREDCFFESHKKYIDIQFMVKGEEYMDVCDLDSLEIETNYVEKTDFIKYKGKENGTSKLLITENCLAIFYPSDAHQPCVKVENKELIYKAVIKIPTYLG